MPPKTVTELEIVIPKEKLNDLNFIYLKLMEVSLDTLNEISKHSDKNFLELVNEFLPELKNLDNDDFLVKWKLSKAILNGSKEESDSSVDIPPPITMDVKTKKLVLPKKDTKPKLTIKKDKSNKDKTKLKKIKLKTATNIPKEEIKETTKPKKIKLVKKRLKLSKKS